MQKHLKPSYSYDSAKFCGTFGTFVAMNPIFSVFPRTSKSLKAKPLAFRLLVLSLVCRKGKPRSSTNLGCVSTNGIKVPQDLPSVTPMWRLVTASCLRTRLRLSVSFRSTGLHTTNTRQLVMGLTNQR